MPAPVVVIEIHRLAKPSDGLETGRIALRGLFAIERADRRQRPECRPDHRRWMGVAGLLPIIHFLEMRRGGVHKGSLRRGQARSGSQDRRRTLAEIACRGQQGCHVRQPVAAENTPKRVDEAVLDHARRPGRDRRQGGQPVADSGQARHATCRRINPDRGCPGSGCLGSGHLHIVRHDIPPDVEQL